MMLGLTFTLFLLIHYEVYVVVLRVFMASESFWVLRGERNVALAYLDSCLDSFQRFLLFGLFNTKPSFFNFGLYGVELNFFDCLLF